MELAGNLKPAVALRSQLGITVHAFRISRLSFIAKVDDPKRRPEGILKFLPAVKVLHTVEVQQDWEVCLLPVSLAETTVTDIVSEQEPEDLVRNFEVARQQAGQSNIHCYLKHFITFVFNTECYNTTGNKDRCRCEITQWLCTCVATRPSKTV